MSAGSVRRGRVAIFYLWTTPPSSDTFVFFHLIYLLKLLTKLHITNDFLIKRNAFLRDAFSSLIKYMNLLAELYIYTYISNIFIKERNIIYSSVEHNYIWININIYVFILNKYRVIHTTRANNLFRQRKVIGKWRKN